MTKIKRLVAVALAVLMILGNLSLMASAWDATVDGGFNLGIDTKIFRSVDGEWVETTKVEQGETVKARVYLSTDYYTNSGNLLFFYNNSFFTDNFSSGNNTLVVNPYYKSSPYLATGVFVGGPQSISSVEKAMVNRNAITQEFADAHEFVYISYYFDGTSYNQKFNGSKWFCEFDLTVKSDASASDEGVFFAVEATTATPDFTRGIIDVPKGEYNTKNAATVSMTDWKATLSYTNTPVTLFTNKVAVSFDANGGSFGNGLTSLHFEGEAGDALAVEDPVKPNYEFKGWVVKDSEAEAAEVSVYPDSDTEYVAVWEYTLSTEETVNFETRFYRLDAETGEWVYTEKAKRGEALKARIFVNTTYFTNAGDLIVFYNNQFFTDTYPSGVQQDLVVNKEAGSAVANGISGHFAKQLPGSMEIANLEEHGYITPEFAESHNAFTIEYGFNPSTGKKLIVNDWTDESNEWLFEFELQVSANATGKDYFWIEQNTIMNPNDGVYAFINVPLSTDGGLNTEVIGLHSVEVESTVKNNFVELESTITLDADGGVFAENDAEEYVIHDYIGTKVVAPQNPTKEGFTFMGWIDEEGNEAEIPAEQPYEDITLTAVWQAEVDISYDTDGDGTVDVTETVTSGEEFVKPEDPTKEGNRFVGWSEDPTGTEITGLPDVYPDTDTTYTAIFAPLSYEVNYYVRDPQTLEYNLVAEVPTLFGELIAHVPSTDYKAPEGYTLSPAYSNASLTVLLADDAKMPANEVDVYFKLVPNTYTVTFDANGGAWEDGATTKDVESVHNSPIVVPATPSNPGYAFLGWFDADGKQPSDYGVMPAGNLEFTAKWSNASSVEYLFEVYEMKVDGTYPDKATSTTTLSGQVGETVIVSSYTAPEGFTVEESKLTGTIEEGTQLVLYVKAKRNSYVFKAYDGQEADASELVNKAYLYGAPVDKLAEPIRDGYKFAGWVDSADEAAAVAATIPVNMPANDVTVYATWTKGTFNATFDAGEGAEFPNGEQTVTGPVELDEPIKAPADEPKKDGYEFVGWAPSDDPDNAITDGDYGNMDADGEEFVAVWKKSTYKVTFYDYVPTDGGYITPTVTKEIVYAEYDYEEKIVFPSEVDLYGYEHYEFMGWTLADNKPIITDDPALLALLVDTENAIADFGNADENGEINYYAVYKRVKVMLIPKNDTCTTVIDRNGLTVDDYVDGESVWYVYGLQEILLEDTLLDDYIDVQGDGRIEIVYRVMENGKTFAPFTGTGTTINVYDNVTDELVESFTIIIYGDLNGDSFIQAIDASIAEDETLGITSWSLDYFPDDYVHYMLKAGDIGGADGYITAKDAVIIEDTALTIYVINQVTGIPE